MRTRWRALPDGAQDALAGLAFAVVWFAAYRYWRAHGWHPRHPEAFELAGAWSAAALALRRLCPLPLLAVTAAVYPFAYVAPLQTEFHLLPVLIAGFAVTSDDRTDRVWSLAAGLAAVAAVLAVADTVDSARVLFDVFATAAVLGLGFVLREQRSTAAALAARNAELERLRRVEAEQAIADERTRIARELHDVVAHHLTAVVIRAQAADRVAATQPAAASEAVAWIATTAREALTAVRQTVKVLRSESDAGPALAPEPSLADLPGIVARVTDAGLPVALELPEPLPALDRQTELAAVRIAQEALTNVLRHARARRAVVSLQPDGEGVVLDVEDDGTGEDLLDVVPDGGHGLVGMRERAASCGGRLSIERSTLGGWRVRAWLPA